MTAISITHQGRTSSTPRSDSHAREVRALLNREFGFIRNEWFRSDAATKHLERALKTGVPRAQKSTLRSVSDRASDMPPTLLRTCQEPLLTADEERELFQLMNLAKYRANQLRVTLDPARRQVRKVEKINRLLALARDAQDRIALANGRLVWSIASPIVSELYTLDELISEGLVALIRAIEKFDFQRGYRFSTYTTLVVRRHLYRFLGDDQKHRSRYHLGSAEIFDGLNDYRNDYRMTESEWQELSAGTGELMDCLDPRENLIIRHRFGLDTRGQSRSLQSIANEMGVCKERVRQLEKRALQGKMREIAHTLAISEFVMA